MTLFVIERKWNESNGWDGTLNLVSVWMCGNVFPIEEVVWEDGNYYNFPCFSSSFFFVKVVSSEKSHREWDAKKQVLQQHPLLC